MWTELSSKDFKVSGSFYYANTYNQTFDPKITVSSGYSTLYVQTGYVRNLGVEGLLSYGHTWRDFGWNSNFTFSWNKNKIVELVKDYVHPETGEIVNKDRLELKGLGYTKFITKKEAHWETCTRMPTSYVTIKDISR